MGVKVDGFYDPVCNSFKAKVLNDQLCYEFDLNKYRDNSNIEKYLKLGLVFFMDYNEDRQVSLETDEVVDDHSWVGRIEKPKTGKESLIHLNTIGKKT